MSTTGTRPYDPRAVANLLLNEADRLGIEIDHVALQKLLFFACGFALVQDREPLCSGYFEAWRNGPVHPVVYRAFSEAGGKPITFRAYGVDALTGARRSLPEIADLSVRRLVHRVIAGYGGVPSGVLVDVSHAKQGPWQTVIELSKSSVALGMRITNETIATRFKYHLVPLDSVRAETLVDAPIESDGIGEKRPSSSRRPTEEP